MLFGNHVQDDISIVRKTGNLFLTNIHRVYSGNYRQPSFEDESLDAYFLGRRPVGKTNESKIDLGIIAREIDELVIINDEAHHIHDSRLAWFKSIEDIKNRHVGRIFLGAAVFQLICGNSVQFFWTMSRNV